jgi:hypothetical protein
MVIFWLSTLALSILIHVLFAFGIIYVERLSRASVRVLTESRKTHAGFP